MTSFTLNQKYHVILIRERQFARKVAMETVDRPEIPLYWLIAAPFYMIFLIHRIGKYKQTVETFAREYLYTKRLALDTALNITTNDGGTVQASAFVSTKETTVHTEEVQPEQRQELELLLDHYRKLLRAEGDNYPAIIKNAYSSRTAYFHFLDRLKEAERQVNLAAMKILDHVDSANVVARMETTTETLRKDEAEQIFS